VEASPPYEKKKDGNCKPASPEILYDKGFYKVDAFLKINSYLISIYFFNHKILIMLQEEKLVTLLSDLVKINNDRIEGYKNAKAASNDADVKALFQHMINDSVKYVAELNEQLLAQGADAETDTTISGKIYRTWMSIKTTFTGTDRYSLFSSCEYGEDAVQRAYADALGSDTSMPYSVRELIANQQANLKEAHDTIKSYRDVVSQ
jgi:uncharacterized protein (TIGR02284 family)